MQTLNPLILLASFFSTALLSWWLVGHLAGYLQRRKIVDKVNERSLHEGSVPRGGGLVIVGLLLLCLISLSAFTERYAILAGLGGVIIAWGSLSWRDDIKPLSERYRLGFHLLFTVAIILLFGHISTIQISASKSLWLAEAGYVVTFIGVIWFANLYNFMDGLDGHAASQTVVASISLAFWFWQLGDTLLTFICLSLAAISYGFLLQNFRPAKIFMGDVGSITLGAFFATLIVYGTVNYQLPVISFVLLFGVFVFDASVTILLRIKRGEKFWQAHRKHYYQRLALAGMGHTRILILQTVLMLFCSLIASISVLYHDRIMFAIFIELLVLVLVAIFVIRYERSHRPD